MGSETIEKKGNGKLLCVIGLPVALALSLVYLPIFWIHVLMLADYYYEPFVLFDSPLALQYHDFLLSRLPDRPEIPLPELTLSDLTKDSLHKASHGYTFPVVIRGVLKDSPAIKQFGNKTWWMENYADEEVLCKYVQQIKTGDEPECTIATSFGDESGQNRMYISGESRIFMRRPELEAMLTSDILEEVAPGERVFTQLFMGFPGMGSDVHSAVGCNLFRQIYGRKKWWLIPQSETPYLRPSINPNGFSAHTKTNIGKGSEDPTDNLAKVVRYTVELEPGDVLLNPAWFWHGIENLGDDPDDLVIGVPTRYSIKYAIPAFKSNPIMTAIALRAIRQRFGSKEAFQSNPGNLQAGIELARTSRAKQMNKLTEEEIREQIEREM